MQRIEEEKRKAEEENLAAKGEYDFIARFRSLSGGSSSGSPPLTSFTIGGGCWAARGREGGSGGRLGRSWESGFEACEGGSWGPPDPFVRRLCLPHLQTSGNERLR